MRRFASLDELRAAVGSELGTSEWLTIDQERINLFADATGDHQWIHVDPELAASGPFGATIAHGHLTLSLIPLLGADVFELGFDTALINYGLEKARFPAPVPVGSRVRSHITLTNLVDTAAGTQLWLRHTIEVEGGTRPACVAETITFLPTPAA